MPGAVQKWTFFDPNGSTTATFLINPNEGGTPSRRRNIAYVNTAAPDGRTLMFEGRRDPNAIEFSGVILESAQIDMFNTWFEKGNQIRMTDDLGRSFWIVILEFTPKRIYKAQRPWKHTYSVRAVEVSYP